MLNSQCRIKANLAQRSAGEVALQRNCRRTRGKYEAAVSCITTPSHVKTRVPHSTCAVAWCTLCTEKHDYIPENVSPRMCPNLVSSSHRSCFSLLPWMCDTVIFASLWHLYCLSFTWQFGHVAFFFFFSLFFIPLGLQLTYFVYTKSPKIRLQSS